MNKLILLSFFLFIGCKSSEDKNLVLLASREAPIGYVTLRCYENGIFNLVYSGRTDAGEEMYHGHFTFRNDTMYFDYTDSIPKRLNSFKALIEDGKYIRYLDASYPESMEINKNQLK